MEKLSRFVLKYSLLVKLTCSILLGVLAGYVGGSLDLALLLVLVTCYPTAYGLAWFIGTRIDYLLRRPVAQLHEHCDPYPFIREVETMRTYSLSQTGKQQMDMNLAMGLQMIGEYEKAYALLSGINIDKYRMGPGNRTVYYNNRMDLCAWMGKYQEANIWYEKAVQLFHTLKPGKIKDSLAHVVVSNRTLNYFCNGEYDRVLQELGKANPRSLCDRVENAMLFARTYLALGETENAVKALRFVADNGNKLYFAAEAKALLVKINKEETL